jgi:hypothetical protein
MASKRNVRRKGCLGKIRYSSEEEGHKVAKNLRYMNSKQGILSRLNVYKCQFCKGLHVGHTNKKTIQGINLKRRNMK